MKVNKYILSSIICVIFLALRGNAETAKTASEFIAQAHNHDNMYILGPEASQQKAISLYNSALTTEPDEKQRLHILYRMAQLYGSSYDLSKGEKPNFHKAIGFYEEIVESYPSEEPLVYKAMSSICDHYTTLREFENAVKWAKKTLEYDTSQMAEQLKAIAQQEHSFERASHDSEFDPLSAKERLEAREQVKQGRLLKKALAKIKRYQGIAVDQVAYSANLIDPLRAHGELRAITEKYDGTFIADRAHERLVENMDKMPDLWAPQNDEPFAPSDSALQAVVSSPAAHTNSQKHKGIKTQTNTIPEATEKQCLVEPNSTDIPQNDKHVAKEPRAPPRGYL